MWADRALDAWASLVRDAIRGSCKAFHVLDGPDGRSAALWPIVHVLWAAAEVQALGGDPPIEQLGASLDRYRSGEAFAAMPGRRRFYDDNAWLGLAMLRLAVVAADPSWHRCATSLARYMETGEDPRGGIRWAEGLTSRNTCSTAAAAWLVLETNAGEARESATRWMDWLDQTLKRPDGLYADRIEDGAIDATAWTYNQGAVLSAARLLDRDTEPLRRAVIVHWSPDRLWHEPPAFAAIAWRALVSAGPVDDALPGWDPYLERLATEAREPITGWFIAGGVGSYDDRPTIDQAAVVQMFALRAALEERVGR
jgi:hypothetical protein